MAVTSTAAVNSRVRFISLLFIQTNLIIQARQIQARVGSILIPPVKHSNGRSLTEPRGLTTEASAVRRKRKCVELRDGKNARSNRVSFQCNRIVSIVDRQGRALLGLKMSDML